MGLGKLAFRNLSYYWRTNLPIVAGVATAVAVLSGALLVGQSVRASLRALLYERIGATEYSLTADHFFTEDLDHAFASRFRSCPIVVIKGMVIQEQTGVRVHDVNVYGVDERFWIFQGMTDKEFPDERAAFVGETLGYQLNASVGDGLLLRIEAQQSIPKEWLYGRRDRVGRTIRLNCRRIIPANQLGEFALRPRQGGVYSIFVPLKRLQRDLEQSARINTILLAPKQPRDGIESIRDTLRENCSLPDLGLRLRADLPRKALSLESNRVILDDSEANTASQVASGLGIKNSALYTYLANAIRANGRMIPYSVITAADLGKGALSSIQYLEAPAIHSSLPGPNESIWLTDWAWRDLGVSQGDSVEVDYYVWQEDGKLATHTAKLRMAGVVSTSGDVNATLAPDIPGITEARSIGAWDPPFPLDLSLIRGKDEDYWNQYRATPKAFITLAKGQELWGSRFGRETAVRLSAPDPSDFESTRESFSRALLEHLDLQEAGILINSVRKEGLAASQGSTDFGEYFIYFSFFLIVAAILLAILFFRLMTEQRIREIGILRATGYPLMVVRRIFIMEGLLLSFTGSLLGILGSLAYGWFMVFGLRNWWVGAVGTGRLFLHISWATLIVGAMAGILVSLAAMLWTLRDLRRNSPRSLLAGVLESMALRAQRARSLRITAIIALTASIVLLASSALDYVPQLFGFFGTGFLLLISILCFTALYFRRAHPSPIRGNGWPAFFRLGLRNATHRPGRSLLCASLIASATFIIVSMEAFRQGPESDSLEKKSGTGGFAFLAESDLPVMYDLNSADGREAVGIVETQIPGLGNVHFTSFRERPGDDASCLNLYAPQEPKILGAPHAFLVSERFSFQDSLASVPDQKRNPWLLLESSPRDEAIPAIADANTIQYILHLSLGHELTVRGDRGKPVRLRLVAALKGSVLQGVLVISEPNFLRAFPEREGFRFFLLESPKTEISPMIQQLKESLADWGFNIESSKARLSAYHSVENTYLTTFQSLGSLGLILGTVGLAAVLLRNVLERRHELALLRAVGYRRSVLSGIVLAENIVLIGWGLVSGTLCALLAIIPALHTRGTTLPLTMTALILAAVLAAGLASSFLALLAAFRMPLLSALHSE